MRSIKTIIQQADLTLVAILDGREAGLRMVEDLRTKMLDDEKSRHTQAVFQINEQCDVFREQLTAGNKELRELNEALNAEEFPVPADEIIHKGDTS